MTKGTKIRSREREQTGEATGTMRRCQLEGCGGNRHGVRWPNGKITWPCGKGLLFDDDRVLRIQ